MSHLIKILTRFVTLLLISLVVFVASAIMQSHPAEAHTVISDGEIGALVYIDPEDEPLVGEPSTIYFEIKDKNSKFTFEQCECVAHIFNRKIEVFTQPLTGTSFIYAFPEVGDYEVKVTGTPRTSGKFQPFTLSYPLHVEKFSANAPTMPTNDAVLESSFWTAHTVHVVLLSLVFGWAFIYSFIDWYKRKQR